MPRSCGHLITWDDVSREEFTCHDRRIRRSSEKAFASHDADRIAAVFTEDAEWLAPPEDATAVALVPGMVIFAIRHAPWVPLLSPRQRPISARR